MTERPRNRFARFVGAFTAMMLIGSSAALAASVGVTSNKITVFEKAGPPAGDTTAPALQALEMFDIDVNGFIDRVVATFDETLAPYTAGNTPWTLASSPSGQSLATNGVSVSGTTATLSLGSGTTAANTASGAFSVSLAANVAGIRDAAGNPSSFTSRAVADKASPARTSLEMFDMDVNGFVDRVVATFSEPLATPYGAGNTPWTLAAVPSSRTLAASGGVTVSGTTATLLLEGGNSTPNTASGSFTAKLDPAANGIRDAAGNLSSFAAAAVADKASPVKTTLEMFDIDTNGFVDRVVATFTETLASTYGAGNTPWTLAFVPSSRTLATSGGVTVSGTTATLLLEGGNGTPNTASGSFTVKLDPTANGIRDAANNPSSFAATAVADKAKPLPMSVSIDKSQLGNDDPDNNGGRPSRADKVVVAFTEALSPGSMCSSTWAGNGDQSLNVGATVRIKNHATATATTDDQLTVSAAPTCGGGVFRFGTVALGSNAYVTADVTFGTGTDTTLVWSAASAVLTITLGAVSGTDATADLGSTKFTAVYTPSSSMTDIAGNTVTGTASKNSSHF